MFGLGHTELLVIGLIVFLIFGAKRLPEIGKGIGGAIREFKSIKKEAPSKEVPDGGYEGKKVEDKKESFDLESKVVNSVVNQMPGVKKVMSVKDKAEKISQIIK